MPKIADKNGMKVLAPINITNNFNDNFFTIAKRSKNIPRNPNSPLNYLNDTNNSTFFISPTDPDEISKIIQSLRKGKALGTNGIPVKLLTILDPKISPHLFNH